ncbi:MAG: hypothetical protein Q9162_006764 [Coniocarpon cinnabarinum]
MPSSKSLLTEHFRYTPLTLIDDIINTVNEIVYRAVDAVEAGLSSTPAIALGFAPGDPSSPDTSTLSLSDLSPEQQDAVNATAKAEIETGVHQLETLLESSVDNNFDRMEIYLLRNILTVPEGLERWIRLRHYDGLQLSAVPSSSRSQTVAGQMENETADAEELLRKRRILHESQRLNVRLREEHSRNAVLLQQLRSLLLPVDISDVAEASPNNLAFLQHSTALASLREPQDAAQAQPIAAQTRAAVAQLPRLKQLVAQLREAQAKGLTLPKRSARDEERRQYLDQGVELAVGE